MTIFINHRINTNRQLAEVPRQNGCEIDIRYHENDLILHHDPFGHHLQSQPTLLNNFLEEYKLRGPLILNIKTEGVERRCIELMNQHKITNWFFLDLSMPMSVIYSDRAARGDIEGFGIHNLAVRFSESEPIEYALSFAGKAGWVWVDCFNDLPLSATKVKLFNEANLKICIVSPELQNHDVSRISEFRVALKDYFVDAICTKRPDLWAQK